MDLKNLALDRISNAGSVQDIALLVKSLNATGQLDSTALATIEAKVDAISSTAGHRDIAYLIKSFAPENPIKIRVDGSTAYITTNGEEA